MRNMKSLLHLGCVIITGLILTTTVSYAAEVKTPPLGGFDPLNQVNLAFGTATSKDLAQIIPVVVSWTIFLTGLTSLAFLVLGGLKWLSSQGDPKALMSAQQTIVGAVIGFIIAFTAYWVIEILQTVLGIKILASIASPTFAQVDIGQSFKLDDTRGIDAVFTRNPLGVGSFVSYLLSGSITIAGVGFLVYLTLGAYRFIISGGDQKAIDSAKKTITSALIGLLIVFSAYWIMEIIQTVTGVPILP